jgi:hypothetical protein
VISSLVRAKVIGVAIALVASFAASGDDEQPIKLADCPVAVRKTLEHEAKGSKIDAVDKVTEDGVTTYGAGVLVGGRKYRIHVDAEGTLMEMGLEVGDEEVKFAASPAAVQATLHREAKDAKFDVLTKDLKYGVTVYEAVAAIGGKEYSIVVAENGTLVEKMLIIAEDEVDLTHCPAAVQHALKEHAQGGKIGPITRATGVGGHVYESELEIKGKAYFIEVTEGGGLITKSLLEEEKATAKR